MHTKVSIQARYRATLAQPYKGISQNRVEIHSKNFFSGLVLNIGKDPPWKFRRKCITYMRSQSLFDANLWLGGVS